MPSAVGHRSYLPLARAIALALLATFAGCAKLGPPKGEFINCNSMSYDVLICAPLAVVGLPFAVAKIASKSSSGNVSDPASEEAIASFRRKKAFSPPQFGSLRTAAGENLVPNGQIYLYRKSLSPLGYPFFTAWLAIDLDPPTALNEKSYVVEIGVDCESARTEARLVETYSKKAGTGSQITHERQIPPIALDSKWPPLNEAIRAMCELPKYDVEDHSSNLPTDSARSAVPAQPR